MFDGKTSRFKSEVVDKYIGFNRLDIFQYGCEFEFYIDDGFYQYKDAIESIKNELLFISSAELLVNMEELPNAKDKNFCMQMKPDSSLGTYGVEISTPISNKEGILHYIDEISGVIRKYGRTNEDTGLHFHISTCKDESDLNFFLYMLLCDEKNLLDKWKPRAYSQNVMDVINQCGESASRVVKNKKGIIWNLEKKSKNHIEIRTVGGNNYHQDSELLKKEFVEYASLFEEILNPTPIHKELIKQHKEKIEAMGKQEQAQIFDTLQSLTLL